MHLYNYIILINIYMHYLSVLAIFKNETMNLKLWIDHYLWQGVDHFYLIDNGSNDNPLSVLQEYIDKGIVSYYFLPEQYKQVEHYRFVFDKANLKKETYWLVVCDLDEFFFGVDKTLKKIYVFIMICYIQNCLKQEFFQL